MIKEMLHRDYVEGREKEILNRSLRRLELLTQLLDLTAKIVQSQTLCRVNTVPVFAHSHYNHRKMLKSVTLRTSNNGDNIFCVCMN